MLMNPADISWMLVSTALVLLMTLRLLDVAITLNPDDFSVRHIWAMLPLLYYVGLWRAKARYQ